MKKAIITVVADQHSDPQLREISNLLRLLYKEHVGDDTLLVIFNEIAMGQFFTNDARSRTSIASVECGNNFPQSKRVVFLEALAIDWAELTQQHPDELMLALVETSLFKRILSSNQQRLTLSGRVRFVFHIAASLIRSTRKRQLLAFNADF